MRFAAFVVFQPARRAVARSGEQQRVPLRWPRRGEGTAAGRNARLCSPEENILVVQSQFKLRQQELIYTGQLQRRPNVDVFVRETRRSDELFRSSTFFFSIFFRSPVADGS